MFNTEGTVFQIQEVNSVWREVLHLGSRQVCSKGHVWSSGGPQRDVFTFIDKGKVRLESVTKSGKVRILMYCGSGCIIREICLLYTSEYYLVNMIAVEPCVVYNFPRALLEDVSFIRQYPHLLGNIMHSIGRKAGAFSSQLTEAAEQSPEMAVYRYLQQLMLEHCAASFAPDISQGDMALALGLHRSTVCRVLKELREQGVLGSFTRGRLEILDADKLNALCKG